MKNKIIFIIQLIVAIGSLIIAIDRLINISDKNSNDEKNKIDLY